MPIAVSCYPSVPLNTLEFHNFYRNGLLRAQLSHTFCTYELSVDGLGEHVELERVCV
jgi:hypothetical protein